MKGKTEEKILLKTCRDNLHFYGPPKPGPGYDVPPEPPLSQALGGGNASMDDSSSVASSIAEVVAKLLIT